MVDAPLKSGLQVLGVGRGVIAVAKLPGVSTEDVLDQLRRQLRAAGHPGDLTVVSRLDKETSGVLTAALGPGTSGAAHFVQAQFAGRFVAKEYTCLCHGERLGPPGAEGEVNVRLSKPVARGGGCYVTVDASGQEALTRYKVLAVYRDEASPQGSPVFTLLEVRPKTGRTHQIRVHMASIGQPLVSDPKYGSGDIQSRALWCPRLFLHCCRVGLKDLAGSDFKVEAPVPADLAAALAHLKLVEGHGPAVGLTPQT